MTAVPMEDLPRVSMVLQVKPSPQAAPDLQVTVDAPNGWVAAAVLEGVVKAWRDHLEAEEANLART